MQDQTNDRSRKARTGGSAGTPGRAGYDQDDNARVADTSPGDIRTGAQASVGRQGGPGVDYTAAERGTAGFDRIPGMQGRTGTWMGEQSARGADFQRREEDLRSRQQDLGQREQGLRERDDLLRMREESLRRRWSRFMGSSGEGDEIAATGTQGQHWRGEPWAKNPKVSGGDRTGAEEGFGTSGQHWRGEDMPGERSRSAATGQSSTGRVARGSAPRRDDRSDEQ